jgi:hypothetical protein
MIAFAARHRARRVGIVVSGLAIVALTACGAIDTANRAAAEKVIRFSYAEPLLLNPESVHCDDPPSSDEGAEWACVGTARNGAPISFRATIADDGLIHVDVKNTVVSKPYLESLMRSAVASLEARTGNRLGETNLSCPRAPLVLGEQLEIPCRLTDPHTRRQYATTIQLLDFQLGTFEVRVARKPIARA